MLVGSATCAFLSALAYIALSMKNVGLWGPALFYGAGLGLAGSVVGAALGLVAALARLNPIQGAITGVLAATAIWILVAFVSGEPGSYGESLRNSFLWLEFIGVPAGAGGLAAALAVRRSDSTKRP
jgi:hypothetical protein